jgi:hypothetical protein
MNPNKCIHIAIQVISFEMNHAYDRRRALPFLKDLNKEQKIIFEPFADIKKLDLLKFDFVIVSIRSDLPFIYKLLIKNNPDYATKFIFDYCDFIHVVGDFKFFIKSIFAKRRKNYSSLFFKKDFLKLITLFDSIVVGSKIQYELLEKYNKNIVIIQDITEEVPLLELKSNTENNGILWEGFASSNWTIFKKIFKYTNDIRQGSKLYIVTDQKYYFLAGRYLGFNIHTVFNFLKIFYPNNSYETQKWNIENLVNYANKCKIAFIPISNNKIAKLKPENKMVIMIRLGLLPIVSNIPAYVAFSEKYDLNICFSNINEFKSILTDVNLQYEILQKVRPHILQDYAYLNIKTKWEKLFKIKI